MTGAVSKILYIAGSMKRKLPLMLVLNLSALVLELVGLSLVIPFLAVLQDPKKLEGFELWNRFSHVMNVQTPLQALIWISILLFCVFAIKTVINIQLQSSIQNFSYDLQVYLRSKFAALYLSASALFHTGRRSNEILNIMQSHISQFSKAVVGSGLRIAGEVITVGVIFFYLLASYPVPTLTALFVLVLFGAVFDRTLKRRLKAEGEELIRANNDMVRSLREGILSIKEARVLGCSPYFLEQIEDSSRRASRVNAYVALIQMLPRYMLELLVLGVVMLSAVILIMRDGSGAEIMDSLAVFAVASIRLLPSANQIVSNISNLRYSHATIHQLYDELQELERQQEPLEKISRQQIFFNSLEIKNIHFRYPGGNSSVLSGLDFSISKGEVIGLAGASGAGKSTLVNILLGLLKPQIGDFLLNGHSISSRDWAGHHFGAYIPQKPVMLDTTILHNVAVGEKTPDRDKVQKALEKAQLWGMVSLLPQALDSPVGEDASLLSGGQRQRLAVARAFYFDRELLVFDEATSALDKNTENEVLQAIGELRQSAAVIMIAHDEQSLQICDRVCYLSEGRITDKT